MRYFTPRLGAPLAALLMLAGCGGDDSGKVTEANQKAFASAPEALQTQWKSALAASATNGYVSAITTLRAMTSQGLSIEQVEAVQAAMRAINGKLTTAIASGDAAALKAQEELKTGSARGGR